MLELVPENETLREWTEMVTVQILRNSGGWTLEGFRAGVAELWAQAYPGGASEVVERGNEQSRPTLIWSQTCPLNRHTGKPENTWFKVLIYGDNLIVVQKAFKFEPSAEAVAFWISFLREVRVTGQR